MATMDKFSIPCTEEQTKKAFELGAPLDIGEGKRTVLCRYQNYNTYKRCVIPTTEQMINWLEEQDISVEITRFDGELRGFEYHLFGIKSCKALFSSRKEATIAAINEALEYLTKNKK